MEKPLLCFVIPLAKYPTAKCSETCEAEQARTLPIDFFLYLSASACSWRANHSHCLSISCGRLANEVKLSERSLASERDANDHFDS